MTKLARNSLAQLAIEDSTERRTWREEDREERRQVEFVESFMEEAQRSLSLKGRIRF